MCISRPQKVIEFMDGYVTVEFMDKTKKVKSPFVLKKGDYIISQSNVVVRKIPEKQALEMLKEWKELNQWK